MALQANCSDLLVLVDRERAEQLLWDALRYAEEQGFAVAPAGGAVTLAAGENALWLTRGGKTLKATLGDAEIPLEVVYDDELGAWTLTYRRSGAPDGYPLVARLSYEFGAVVTGDGVVGGGGHVEFFQEWLERCGIPYREEGPGLVVTGEPVCRAEGEEG